jgi:hypothetical protein
VKGAKSHLQYVTNEHGQARRIIGYESWYFTHSATRKLSHSFLQGKKEFIAQYIEGTVFFVGLIFIVHFFYRGRIWSPTLSAALYRAY